MGHSMGGRMAMFFAALHPRLIEKLIIVDISPCSYQAENHPDETLQHKTIIQALQSIDFRHIKSRTDADRQLAKVIKSATIRQFLLKNLKTERHKGFHWSLNLPVLEKNLPEIFLGIDTLYSASGIQMDFPALFIRGQLSGYIGEHDLRCIERYFTNHKVVTIPGATHWVHAEQPGPFLEAVVDFIKSE
jgi:pimeloyl-ACP methyl ester carboxylesterase